jgi:hypothetical protein
MYWLVMPQVPATLLEQATTHQELWDAVGRDQASAQSLYRYFEPHLLDLTCLAGLVGLCVFATIRRMTKSSLIPVGDPRLHESLAFENM